MARIKNKKEATIKSFDEADLAVQQIGEMQRRIETLKADAGDRIDTIKKLMDEEVKPLQAQIKARSAELEVFAVTHHSDFGRSKSRRLTFGVIGWRRSTSIRCGKKAVELIREVFGRRARNFLKVKETPNKDELKALSDDELKRIDSSRQLRDVFFVEPDQVEPARD
jgi:phage host-nuclease inhibitor protein Gam